MRALVVFAHPVPESFGAALRDTTVAALNAAGHEVQLVDLYASGFDPVMSTEERRNYNTAGINEVPIRAHLDLLHWCEMLVLVYPTWWFGPPAMMKGWLDRVWVPHATFVMPTKEHGTLRRMENIRKIAIVTTCGASWWFSKFMLEPGRNSVLRGIGAICAAGCKKLYLAHYEMDSSTPESRANYLAKVKKAISGF